ncbi:hypothetical protein KFE25_007247 [Diacronema lutheri]|uniref:FHA domain-containing protein n=1 Tax=Diacronema lutheri TaxID=2081491 RepID=A0A8J5X7V4_DIALT|nr:hypothetical protein KFE25_007247 [Diacronema lutheri]
MAGTEAVTGSDSDATWVRELRAALAAGAERITIGRAPGAGAIVIDSPLVSRAHAELVRAPGAPKPRGTAPVGHGGEPSMGARACLAVPTVRARVAYRLTDLGSANGTFVQGGTGAARVRPGEGRELHGGERVTLGPRQLEQPFCFRFELRAVQQPPQVRVTVDRTPTAAAPPGAPPGAQRVPSPPRRAEPPPPPPPSPPKAGGRARRKRRWALMSSDGEDEEEEEEGEAALWTEADMQADAQPRARALAPPGGAAGGDARGVGGERHAACAAVPAVDADVGRARADGTMAAMATMAADGTMAAMATMAADGTMAAMATMAADGTMAAMAALSTGGRARRARRHISASSSDQDGGSGDDGDGGAARAPSARAGAAPAAPACAHAAAARGARRARGSGDGAADGAADDGGPPALSEYEQQRLANMAANRAKLIALGLASGGRRAALHASGGNAHDDDDDDDDAGGSDGAAAGRRRARKKAARARATTYAGAAAQPRRAPSRRLASARLARGERTRRAAAGLALQGGVAGG